MLRIPVHNRFLLFTLLAVIANGEVGAMENPKDLQIPRDGWRLVTDGVMGGVSRGTMTTEVSPSPARIRVPPHPISTSPTLPSMARMTSSGPSLRTSA